jgi:hypothetical protein
VLDRLIEAVRGGESRALVVRGQPGMGKTPKHTRDLVDLRRPRLA